jgi:aldehyde:ferredoxin oxidoreductase
MKPDVESEEFVRYFLNMITYRKGNTVKFLPRAWRAQFARWARRNSAIRFTGRFSQITGERLDIPVSLETAWGHSYHWQAEVSRARFTSPPGWLPPSNS